MVTSTMIICWKGMPHLCCASCRITCTLLINELYVSISNDVFAAASFQCN